MAKFADVVKARQEEAQAWLEEHKHLLDPQREISPQESNGNETGMGEFSADEFNDDRYDPFYLLAKVEVQGGFWADSINEATVLEEGGQYNIRTLDHWKGKVERESGLVVSHREMFLPEKHKKHNQRQAKKRAQFGIEWTSTKGDTPKHRQVKTRISQTEKRLRALQKRAAAAKARASK